MKSFILILLFILAAMAVNGQTAAQGHSSAGGNASANCTHQVTVTVDLPKDDCFEERYTYCYHFCQLDLSWSIDGHELVLALVDSGSLRRIPLVNQSLDLNNPNDLPFIQAELDSILGLTGTWVMRNQVNNTLIDIRIPDLPVHLRPLFLYTQSDNTQLSAPFARSCRWW